MESGPDLQSDTSNLASSVSTDAQQQQQNQQQPTQQQDGVDATSNININLNTTDNHHVHDQGKQQQSAAPSATASVATSHLFSTKKWGSSPVRQDTPWELPPSPTNSVSSTAANAAAAAAVAQVAAASAPPPQPTAIAPSLAPASPFANHNLMNPSQVIGGGMQKSLIGGGPGGSLVGAGSLAGGLGAGLGGNGINSYGMQQQSGSNEFARAPGPASSMMDNNMTPKPFGIQAVRSTASTWSAFGAPTPNEPESEWPKTTAPPNAFDLVFGGGGGPYSGGGGSGSISGGGGPGNRSPTHSSYEPSGIGTWSPVVKGGRPGSKWDGDGPDGRGDNGRFDDGTALWGSPAQTKVAGVDWVDKTGGDANSNNNDKSRSMSGNNQSYRNQQQQQQQSASSSSAASLLMSSASSNTSPSSQQHNRNQQQAPSRQPSSHNFDQVQQQSNALSSSQANQPNRGLGLSASSSNVPSTQQLKHMVQQIQLAVQAGHLNPQILNQPLSPITLQLLYQLLQQIKILQQLQMQALTQFNKPGNHPAAVNVHITKTKQNILNLQNQINNQQAVYLRAQGHNISPAAASSLRQQGLVPALAPGGLSGGIGPTLPPGISQSGDSFRSSASVGDFSHVGGGSMNNVGGVDSMGANGLANSLGHMSLGSGNGGPLHSSSRFDPPWRPQQSNKQQHQTSSMASASPFSNHNLMNPAPVGVGMQKSMIGGGSSASSYGMQQQSGSNEFARAPGPASSMMDNNMTPKPFGIQAVRSTASTWSAFGAPTPNEPESEWPKTTTTTTSSGTSAGNSNQPSNAFDLVPEFEPGKPWRGSMLMKSVEDDPTMTPGSMARSLAPQRKTIWSD